MANRSLTGAINLKALQHAMYTTSKGALCIMIPVEANMLEIDEQYDKLEIPVRVTIYDEQKNSQDGLISKAIGSKRYKAATPEQQAEFKDYKNEKTKKLTAILGNVKDWSNQGGSTNNALSNDIHQAPADGVSDDLPF